MSLRSRLTAFASLVVVFAAMVLAGPANAAASRFVDTGGHVFQHEVEWLASAGVSRGWEVAPDTHEFRPQAHILRGEMAAFLYRLAGSPEFHAPERSPFVDVHTGFVFYKEIAWLAQSGISRGWSVSRGAEFRPFQTTSRDVMATFLHRFQGSPGLPGTASPFRDVNPGTVFHGEITWLAAQGVSTGWDMGYGCRDYRPYQSVTRSEMAAFLYRMENGGTLPLVGNGCTPPPRPTPSPVVAHPVTPGAWCKAIEAGWYGYSARGLLMRCVHDGESRPRWRQA